MELHVTTWHAASAACVSKRGSSSERSRSMRLLPPCVSWGSGFTYMSKNRLNPADSAQRTATTCQRCANLRITVTSKVNLNLLSRILLDIDKSDLTGPHMPNQSQCLILCFGDLPHNSPSPCASSWQLWPLLPACSCTCIRAPVRAVRRLVRELQRRKSARLSIPQLDSTASAHAVTTKCRALSLQELSLFARTTPGREPVCFFGQIGVAIQ